MSMNLQEILHTLEKESNPQARQGMARVGITPDKAFGIQIPVLRKLATFIGKNHDLALRLWDAGYRETQILAAMVDEPDKVTVQQMDQWAKEFTYWEICDQCCMNLFYLLPSAPRRAIAWSRLAGEQQKRAGFALMAVLAWKNKQMGDEDFLPFFPEIIRGATDERPPVKKAISWALRKIGIRSTTLRKKAVEVVRELAEQDNRHARWIAKDVFKELSAA